jgi:hypothetical protein
MRDIALFFRKFSNADMDSFADADLFDTDLDPAVHFSTDRILLFNLIWIRTFYERSYTYRFWPVLGAQL